MPWGNSPSSLHSPSSSRKRSHTPDDNEDNTSPAKKPRKLLLNQSKTPSSPLRQPMPGPSTTVKGKEPVRSNSEESLSALTDLPSPTPIQESKRKRSGRS